MSFTAKFPGRCGAGDRIEPGDEVDCDEDDVLVHAGCVGSTPARPRPTTTCTACWLIQPCECEE